MANEWLTRLRGTMSSLLGIGGTSGVNIKNSSGSLQVRNAADSAFADIVPKRISLQGNNATNAVVVTVPDALAGTVTLVLPEDAGADGQFLQTDGTGTLVWASGLTGADITIRTPFTEANTTLTVFASPPDNSILRKIVIEVEVAAAGGSPTLEIGISGDTDLYVLPVENDLKTVALYVINLEEELGITPADVIATIAASAQTFSGNIILVYGV